MTKDDYDTFPPHIKVAFEKLLQMLLEEKSRAEKELSAVRISQIIYNERMRVKAKRKTIKSAYVGVKA